MSDDKNIRDGRDRSKVSSSEDYEVQFIADKLKVQPEEVRAAIQKVGNDREKVEEYLRKSK